MVALPIKMKVDLTNEAREHLDAVVKACTNALTMFDAVVEKIKDLEARIRVLEGDL